MSFCPGSMVTLNSKSVLVKPYITWDYIKDIVPVYTAPSRIATIWDDSDKTDVAITRAIEKEHGIGE